MVFCSLSVHIFDAPIDRIRFMFDNGNSTAVAGAFPTPASAE